MKKIICFLNGVTDEPLEDLQGATPLEKAKTPTLDTWFSQGNAYQLYPENLKGVEPIFGQLVGIDSSLENLSKASLEAYCLGYRLAKQQWAACVRFVSEGKGIVIDVDEHLLQAQEVKALCKSMNEKVAQKGWCFFPLERNRALLISQCPLLKHPLEEQWHFHPGEVLGRSWRDLLPSSTPEGEEDLWMLAQTAHSVLADHEVNQLRQELEEPFVNAFLIGHSGPSLGSLGLQLDYILPKVKVLTRSFSLAGFAKFLGYPYHHLQKETRKYSCLPKLLKMIEDSTKDSDYLFVDLDYLWQSTLEGDLLSKIKGLEYLDRNFFKHLQVLAEKNQWELLTISPFHSSIEEGKIIPGPSVALRVKPEDFSKNKKTLKFCEKNCVQSKTLSFSELLSVTTCI
jgi:2,3-bisphosphoglycerate-independent phosphoglycerate mutase